MTTLSTHSSRSKRLTSEATTFMRAPVNETLNVRVFATFVRKNRTTSPRLTLSS